MYRDRLFNKDILFLTAASLALNIFGSHLATALGWPLFLDSAGTVLAAALGGYLPGIVVGFFSNYIISFGDEVTMYYGILNILIAIASVRLSKRGAFKHFTSACGAVCVFAFIGGVLGALITWGIFGFDFGSGISAPLAVALNARFAMEKFAAQLTADLLLDVADKALTVMLVCFVLAILPGDLLKKLPLGGLYVRKGSAGGAIGDRLAKGYHGFSLSTKVATLIIITASILSLLSVSISYRIYRDTMDKRYYAQCAAAVNLMSAALDGDALRGIISAGKETAAYREFEKRLTHIKRNMPDITYMYVYQIKNDGCHVVFDLDTPDVKGAELGDVVDFDDMFKKYLPDLLAGREIAPITAYGQFGWLMSVYKPILDSEKKCVAYAAVDIAMDDVVADRYIFVIRVLSLLFGASVIIVSFSLWFAQKNIVAPLNSLASATNRFAYESEDERMKNRRILKDLRINTGDEIEYLYTAISKTISDIFDYLRVIDEKNADVAAKAKVISKMQDNIIISFANMVENRDDNTGCHIKRTAAYVRAISDEMSKNPRYRDQLTFPYREKLEKSAPLHDIGKIKIPDGILNKPGKLTPEEFEVIKSHTSAGREILEHAFIGGEDDNYLSEAMKMAYCHHEKWDGKGYPNGMREDEIPLCARIMALADVFDALISRRSYKEPLSFENAVSIIKGESGSHFDPDVVAAFLNIKEDIRRIAEDNA